MTTTYRYVNGQDLEDATAPRFTLLLLLLASSSLAVSLQSAARQFQAAVRSGHNIMPTAMLTYSEQQHRLPSNSSDRPSRQDRTKVSSVESGELSALL